MDDYLLCHAAFVIPVAFACYKTNGNLNKIKRNNAYLNKIIDANIEAYRIISNAVMKYYLMMIKTLKAKNIEKLALNFLN